MEKKVLLSLVFFLFFMFLLQNVSADLNDTQISKGYSCLQNKTASCSTSLDDNIFTLLSIKTCKDKVLQASNNNGECWPNGACTAKQTAQALFALKQSGADTSKPKAWLISHTKTPTTLEWFLEVETDQNATCSIDYSGRSYPFSIGDDKKISSSSLGLCLSLAQDNYWLKISRACQNYQYEISCTTSGNKDFATSKLFKEQTSDTIHVTTEINTASSGGTTTEQVNSSCFADSSSCSYEGTLWGAMVLNSMDYDISSYLPYLVTMADNNPRTFPEAFLYVLLGDAYKNDLLLKQKSSKYWEPSGDRYYDTALALLALKSIDVNEKSNALSWLGDNQGSDGCWSTGIKNNAFLLFSISPRENGGTSGGTSTPGCEAAGYFCSSSVTCTQAGGSVLENYQCSSGLLKCCDRQKQALTCVEQGGEICTGQEQCVGGVVAQASDVTYAECCVGGACIIPDNGNGGAGENMCETSNGVCRTSTCLTGEQADSTLDCSSQSEVCCLSTGTPSTSSYLWIWILVILIILVIVAIIFRDKLRRFWLYAKTKFGPSGPSGSSHQSYFEAPMRRMIPRRILPRSGPAHHGPTPARRPSGELDDVLKKLKDMSR